MTREQTTRSGPDRKPTQRFFVKEGAVDRIAQVQAWYKEVPQLIDPFFKPLSINVQGDVTCPVGCSACGIDAVRTRGHGRVLPEQTRLDVLDQAADAGIISYLGCVGDAEPFITLQFLTSVIERFHGRMDLTKINTTGITFTDVDHAIRQLTDLRNAGWTDSTYIVPVLSLSLGMQQEAANPVPLDRLVNGIIAFHKVFKPGEVHLSISHYHTTTRYHDAPDQLRQAFHDRTGQLLDDYAIVKTNEIIAAGRASRLDRSEFKPFIVSEKVSGRKCYGQSVGEYVDPVMTVDEYGNIWMCPSFGPHEGTKLGNIATTTLKESIISANQNDFFRLIARGGTLAVFELAEKYEPSLGDRMVTNRHQPCAMMWDIYANNETFRQDVAQAAWQ